MISIREIHAQTEWNVFLRAAEPHTFLHAWEWGAFQESQGERIWRFGIFENNMLFGIALIIRVNARRGTFLFCPHGPIFARNKSEKAEEMLKVLADTLKKLAEKEHAGFIRICPLFSDSGENRTLFKNLGFRHAPIHMHPERAWILDVSKSEEELLKGMRKQTRHCIRNAAAMGVVVSQSEDTHDIDRFYAIYEATVARHDFVPFSRDYLKKEFAAFAKEGDIKIFLGTYHGEIISGAIVVFANGSGFYHHGASDPKFAKVPAAHLLQWEIIKEVQRRELRWYNFWGVAPENAPKHPWAGLSLFKKGFGGFSEEYVPAQDLPLKASYWLTYGAEKVRKWKRGL